MPVSYRKKRKRKVKFRTITLKLSDKQKKSLVNYCRARRTTPNKLIKKSISRFTNGFDKKVPKEFYSTEKQLDLFE